MMKVSLSSQLLWVGAALQRTGRPGLGDAHGRRPPPPPPSVTEKGSICVPQLMDGATILVVSPGLLSLCGSIPTEPGAPCLTFPEAHPAF